ncbi:hypothetical protein NP233_g11586 [Leucocoprinus birnbaumii]|uniref:LsmAD domain-containing protein n=1 Tax=Leucocoprinus birnbaumii TaxID=56174 RepID=A0AAD5VI67_9AGAR|nr:hypothetical protein NP233_g11586 [Leucocoprinus birnbaumii]
MASTRPSKPPKKSASKKSRPSSSSQPNTQRGSPLPQTNNVHSESPLLFYLAGLTGTTVTLTTKTGGRYEGVVSSTSSEGDTAGVTLNDVKDFRMPGAPLKDSFFVAAINIETYTSGPAGAGPINGITFKTDANINRKKSAKSRKRELQAKQLDINGPTLAARDDTFGPSTGTSAWDQFAANEKPFGITDSFNENEYTAKLDRDAGGLKERGETNSDISIGASTAVTASGAVGISGALKGAMEQPSGDTPAAGTVQKPPVSQQPSSSNTAQTLSSQKPAGPTASKSETVVKKFQMFIQPIPPFKGDKAKQTLTSSASSSAVAGAAGVNGSATPATGTTTATAGPTSGVATPISPTTATNVNGLNVNASSSRPGTRGSVATSTTVASPEPKAEVPASDLNSSPINNNPFFGVRPLEKGSVTRDDFNPFKSGKLLEITSIGPQWPYQGKRYTMMFMLPPVPHPLQHQSHMESGPESAASSSIAIKSPHIREEHVLDDSSVSEEDQYGAVVRGQGAYIPPGARRGTGDALSPPSAPGPTSANPDVAKAGSLTGPEGVTLAQSRIPDWTPPPAPSATTPKEMVSKDSTTSSPEPSLFQHSKLRKRRRGFWNRRGDHVTPEGYIVYVPGPSVYPQDLDDYPDGKDGGFKNEHGMKLQWEPRPEISPDGGYDSIIEWFWSDDGRDEDSSGSMTSAESRAKHVLHAITTILGSAPKYKKFLDVSTKEAETLLDLLQKLLDFDKVPDKLRKPMVSAMMRLCKASGTYPQCLALRNIHFQATPLASGSYGDIFQG